MKGCKNICDTMLQHKKRPQKMPFITHSHCRNCELWIKKGEGWGKNGSRCPCCHGVLSILPRLNQKKKAYREVMATINYTKINVPVKKNPFPDEDVEKW